MIEITKHAILIGINDVPNLPYLDSPSRYAMQMQTWAKNQGYITSLFVDQPDGEITGTCSIGEIKKTVRTIIENGTDQLLVYFSGHGVEHTAGNDVWLLPDYENDTNDCISISLNKILAYNSGIPHVIFISDACRVPSNLNALRAASGSGILPILNNLNPDTEVDILYSTWPGQLAEDIQNEDGSYRSIYSDRLLECLNGHIPEVIKPIQNSAPGFPAVISDDLGRYLKKVVPVETAASGGKRQFPMHEVTSRDPLHLAKFTDEETLPEITEAPNLPVITTPENALRNITVLDKLEELALMRGINVDTAVRNVISHFNQDLEFFTSPNVFDRRMTGLFVTGITQPLVFSRKRPHPRYRSKRNFTIPQLIVLEEEEEHQHEENIFLIGNPRTKRFYPVSVLPGFFTQVVFEKGILLTVNYFPTHGWRKEEAHRFAEQVAHRKAEIITAAKSGIFLADNEIADFIRLYKSLDPTLGLFSAYAYFQKGDYAGVTSVYHHMRKEPEPVLGDVRLLAKLSRSIDIHDDLEDIPLPVLTQGWSYLKLLPESPHSYLSTQLEPGLWTSFNHDGLRYLIENKHYRQI